MMRLALLLLLLLFASAAEAAHPLFAADEPIRIALRGPIDRIARNARDSTDPHDAVLVLDGGREAHRIRLSARGLTRRQPDVCSFPPLRIEFADDPADESLFRGQRRLKLVTHCRPEERFEQHVLREYAAYRLYNALTPVSLRARLARIDYRDAGGETVTRFGFLVEDVDDAARRNGLVEIDTMGITPPQLSPREAALYAVFQYMIGNTDWAMTVSPPGSECCHNSKLLGAAAGAADALIPIPYDFDHSGLVDAPYATPPPGLRLASVRVRRYRGYCLHNAEARAAAGQVVAARPRLMEALAAVPHLDGRSRERAAAYLSGFFDDVATPRDVESNLLRTCRRWPSE